MKTWTIPTNWEMKALVTTEADTLSEAIQKVKDNCTILPDNGEYVEGSWKVEPNDVEYIRKHFNNNQSDDISALEKMPWGWQYTSLNGIKYTIGEVTGDYHAILDEFEDISEMFDGNILIEDHFVSYVHGDIVNDTEDIKEFLDWRIPRYENHERTIRFHRDIIGRPDEDVFYECYIGKNVEMHETTTKISTKMLKDMATEDRA